MTSVQDKARSDLEAYEARYRADLEESNRDEYALFYQGELIDVFCGLEDACREGEARYGDQHFSVIHIGHTEIHLGFYSMA